MRGKRRGAAAVAGRSALTATAITAAAILGGCGSGGGNIAVRATPPPAPTRILYTTFDTGAWSVGPDGGEEPRPAGMGTGVMPGVLSPDGRRVALVSSRDGSPEIYVAEADGTGTPRRITRNTDTEFTPTWSPDGTRLLYYADPPDESPGGEVRTVRIADGAESRVGDVPERHYWLPDGRLLHADADGLTVQNADGTGARVIAPGIRGGYPHHLFPSPDGTRVALVPLSDVGPSPGESADWHVVDLSTGRVARIDLPGRALFEAAWSPDGRRLALTQTDWTVNAGLGSSRPLLLVADVTRPEEFPRIVARINEIVDFGNVGDGDDFVWTRDGSRLLYNGLTADGRTDGILSADPNSDAPHAVFSRAEEEGVGGYTGLVLAPDGSRLLYRARTADRGERGFVVGAAGGTGRPFTPPLSASSLAAYEWR